MRPIQIIIKKKTRVPTKHQIRYLFRTAWEQVGKITYEDSYKLFKSIGGGPIETDAQFAKFILDNIGPGAYICIVWRKKMEGFRKFIYLEVKSDSFCILKKAKTFEERQKEESIRKLRRLNKKLSETRDNKEKQEIELEVNDLKEEIDFEKELTIDNSKMVASSYLKISKPIYKPHSYRPFIQVQERKKEIEVNDFW